VLARFGLYDFFANIIPGIFFLWALAAVVEIPGLRQALPLAGGLAETSVLIVVGYLAGLLLQAVSQLVTERTLRWWWGGFPSERWLLPEDEGLTAEYKTQLSQATNRRFNVALEAAPMKDGSKAQRRGRLKRNQEIFYRCYRAVEKASGLPATFNAQYGLFRGLLTTFVLLAIVSLGFVVRERYLTGRFALSPHVSFAAVSVVGGVLCYFRTKKRGEDFAKAVLDVFLVSEPGVKTG
jgi:hypothetical protein